MMNYEVLYKNLLSRLRSRIPQNSKLVAKLVDILDLEKESVYRRLREDVPFTFEEMVIMAKEFNISLDNMLGVATKTSFPFRYNPEDKVNPVEINYTIIEEYIQSLKDICADPAGEIMLATNMLPQMFYTGFQSIYRFYFFKWRYYSIPNIQTEAYHEVLLPKQLIQAFNDIFLQSKKINSSHLVFDNQVFQNFVNDVMYFNSIRLITNGDIKNIKEELFGLLDYLETLATKGFADDPEHKVYIYNSDTNIDTSYFCFDSNSSSRFAMVLLFIFNSVVSFDEEMLERIKCRIRLVIRTSTLLSVTGKKFRMEYFEAQRKIVRQM